MGDQQQKHNRKDINHIIADKEIAFKAKILTILMQTIFQFKKRVAACVRKSQEE